MRTRATAVCVGAFVALVVSNCRAVPPRDTADLNSEREPFSEGNQGACSLADYPCPQGLPHLGPKSLPAQSWQDVERLAPSGLITVAIHGEQVRIEPACLLQGRYHEVARAPTSPGRGWVASRMLVRAEDVTEVDGCKQATHLVALFARHTGQPDGEMLLMPLPCPPDFAAGDGCIAAGASPQARRNDAEALALRVSELRQRSDHSRHAWNPEFVAAALELAARMPTHPSVAAIRDEALAPLRADIYGGCAVVMESDAMSRELEGQSEAHRRETWLETSASPHYACRTQPSFVQCMPETFTPGAGSNCWSPYADRD